MAPTEYYCVLISGEREERVNCRSLRVALKRARTAAARGLMARVCRRINIRDITPSGDVPGLLWEWDDVVIWDSWALDCGSASL